MIETGRVEADEHCCAYREQADKYRTRVESFEAEVAELKRYVFGQRSEAMPSFIDSAILASNLAL